MPHLDGVNDGIGYGVKGENTTAASMGNNEPGIIGTSSSGVGVYGSSGSITGPLSLLQPGAIGVAGVCADGTGVSGLSGTGSGIFGSSESGLAGQFNGNVQVNGSTSISGVLNVPSIENTASSVLSIKGSVTCQSMIPNEPGVLGLPMPVALPGVPAIGVQGSGGSGFPSPGPGIAGRQGIGVFGTTSDPNGIGVWGQNTAGGNAGAFDGNVAVSGLLNVPGTLNVTGTGSHTIAGTLAVPGTLNVTGTGSHKIEGTLNVGVDVVLTNQDCAEDFDIGLSTNLEPGTVMALDEHGLLQESRHAYDRKVAGVISGAGEFKPGLILGRDKVHGDCRRAPVALVGKVYCKVDAQNAPIEIGDLLTTSGTPGHAMKAEDSIRAFGAVIGKALRPLSSGRGLVPILVALQ
jgi:hypothetical protein